MSHVVSIKTEVRDVAAIRAACRRLNIDRPEEGTFELFSGEATGVAVRLPDWTYPVVCDIAAGELKFDNYSGRWGDQKELDAFLQAYAVEKSTHSQCTSCYGFRYLVTRGSLLHLRLAL